MNEGWIKLYRKIEQHWLYPKDREFTEYEAWQDILLQVNHKSKKVRVKNKIFTCKRGQSLRSVKQWGKRWKWSKSKVYRFFDLLEQDNMIKTVSETVTTRLTVCNYDSYQEQRNADETESERRRNDPETVSDTNKNEKNVKNEKKIHALQELIEKDLQQVSKLDQQLTYDECEKLLEKFTPEMVEDVLLSMENYNGLKKKYKSVYLTTLNWCKKRQKDEPKKQHRAKIV